MPDLKHSAVLVTGTDRGIGRLCASRLASRGRRVFAGVLDEDAASAWRTEGLAGLEPVLLDVRDPACIASAVSAVESALGGEPLGGLVNNAAVAAPGPLELLSAEQVREVFAVNVLGAVETTRACLPLLRASRGRVVHVGSSAGRLATPMMGAYCASKAALEAIADTHRRELGGAGVHVSLVAPGPVATGVWEAMDAALEDLQGDDRARAHYAEALAGFRRMMGGNRSRAVEPSRVVEAIEHALSSARPRLRYAVGLQAKLGSVLYPLLPARLTDRLLALLAAR